MKKIKPYVNNDSRGHLYEVFSLAENYNIEPKHMYISSSKKGVVRGFHQQTKEPQTKLIYCLSGKINDFTLCMDLNGNSFGEISQIQLDGSLSEGILIEKGEAHGFECLEDCQLLYICDQPYDPSGEFTINPLADNFSHLWEAENPIISERDKNGLSLEGAKKLLTDAEEDKEIVSEYKVFYAEANYGAEEISAVNNVLINQRHNMVTSHNVTLFEEKVAKLFVKSYGVMSNSGSSANLLALASFDFKPGSNVITPCLTFSTTVAPIVQCGLVPNFVDCDIENLQIDVSAIEKSINDDTVALLIPNLIGNIPDWKKISEIASKYKLVLIEDSADTIGYKLGEHTGNPYTDVATTSFYASHVITGAGTGGMTCFNDSKLKDKALSLRGWGRRSTQYGETEDTNRRLSATLDGMDYDDKYIFDDLGYNFIPSEVSAAFALVQLGKLSKNVELRISNYQLMSSRLSKHNELIKLFESNYSATTNWLAFPLLLIGKLAGKRKSLQSFLEDEGIQTRTIFTGNILRHPAMQGVDYIGDVDKFPNADNVMKDGILLGCHSRLTSDQLNYVCDKFDEYIEKNL